MWILNINNNSKKNNLNSEAFKKKTFWKVASFYIFNLIKLLLAAFAPTVAPYGILLLEYVDFSPKVV